MMMMLYGVAHVGTGLALIFSLGYWNPSWHSKVSMMMARQHAFKLYKDIRT